MSVSQIEPQADRSAAPLRGRIMRHLLADRIYHWTMAACVLTLMATAFLPIIGYKFENDVIVVRCSGIGSSATQNRRRTHGDEPVVLDRSDKQSGLDP